MGKKKKVEKPSEDKHEKFIRVVTPRVGKALKAIALIANQAGIGYSYTEDDVAQIITALRDAIDNVEGCYLSKNKQIVEFSFE